MVEDKHRVKEKDLHDIAQKLGLSSIVEANIGIFRDNYFNDNGELNNNKFLEKLFDSAIVSTDLITKKEPPVIFSIGKKTSIQCLRLLISKIWNLSILNHW